MNKVFLAALTALSALVGTLGSLFLAYDYLDDPSSNAKNPLRLLLRTVVPIIAGMLPGVLVLLIFSTLQIDNFQFLDVIVHVIALGALAGAANAWFIGDADGLGLGSEDLASRHYSRVALLHIRRTLGRALVGLILGASSGFIVALILRTTVDNALTTAGGTGPITMALFGVWPLIRWTPTLQMGATGSSPIHRKVDRLLVLLPGIAVLSLCVGLVNGFFNSRAPQNIYACIVAQANCEKVLTPSAIVGIGDTMLVHGGVFLVGGTLTGLVWPKIEAALIYLWDHVLARSPVNGAIFGSVLTAAGTSFAALAVIIFMTDAAPAAISDNLLFVSVVAPSFIVGACLGFFVPLRPIQATLASSRPFSRFDASIMTCFALCVLLPYITLTNLGDLCATLLGYPHALGPQTTPPVQFQRIAFYSKAAVLLGIPVALAVGGLTRAVYRWAKELPHKALGAVGIGLLLLAFLLQLAEATVGLLAH